MKKTSTKTKAEESSEVKISEESIQKLGAEIGKELKRLRKANKGKKGPTVYRWACPKCKKPGTLQMACECCGTGSANGIIPPPEKGYDEED